MTEQEIKKNVMRMTLPQLKAACVQYEIKQTLPLADKRAAVMAAMLSAAAKGAEKPPKAQPKTEKRAAEKAPEEQPAPKPVQKQLQRAEHEAVGVDHQVLSELKSMRTEWSLAIRAIQKTLSKLTQQIADATGEPITTAEVEEDEDDDSDAEEDSEDEEDADSRTRAKAESMIPEAVRELFEISKLRSGGYEVLCMLKEDELAALTEEQCRALLEMRGRKSAAKRVPPGQVRALQKLVRETVFAATIAVGTDVVWTDNDGGKWDGVIVDPARYKDDERAENVRPGQYLVHFPEDDDLLVLDRSEFEPVV